MTSVCPWVSILSCPDIMGCGFHHVHAHKNFYRPTGCCGYKCYLELKTLKMDSSLFLHLVQVSNTFQLVTEGWNRVIACTRVKGQPFQGSSDHSRKEFQGLNILYKLKVSQEVILATNKTKEDMASWHATFCGIRFSQALTTGTRQNSASQQYFHRTNFSS